MTAPSKAEAMAYVAEHGLEKLLNEAVNQALVERAPYWNSAVGVQLGPPKPRRPARASGHHNATMRALPLN